MSPVAQALIGCILDTDIYTQRRGSGMYQFVKRCQRHYVIIERERLWTRTCYRLPSCPDNCLFWIHNCAVRQSQHSFLLISIHRRIEHRAFREQKQDGKIRRCPYAQLKTWRVPLSTGWGRFPLPYECSLSLHYVKISYPLGYVRQRSLLLAFQRSHVLLALLRSSDVKRHVSIWGQRGVQLTMWIRPSPLACFIRIYMSPISGTLLK